MTVDPQELLGTVTAESGIAGTAPIDDTQVPSRARIVFRRFLHHKLAVVGLVFVVLLVLMAFVGIHLTKWKYTDHDFNALQVSPNSDHWFGTDLTGKDMFAATMRGAQKSIIIGLLVALMATGIAAIVGSFSGYFGRWVDRVLMWLVNMLLIVPSFLIIAILSPQFHNFWLFVVLLGMFIWQITARIVRGQTLSLREREYVLAAKYMGLSGPRIIARHILPNLASLLIIDATVNISVAVLTETGLSFFGFGVQPPDISLGTLISDAQTSATTFPWLFLFPAGFLTLFVLSVNLVGNGLRDALDPTSGQAR
ncbi:MAG TPA: ABC transporter permease [Mycobacteriales bacterium]|nr:ABC transporter permease [Mycobacteriales bacterium]